jgi:hypothetical protein
VRYVAIIEEGRVTIHVSLRKKDVSQRFQLRSIEQLCDPKSKCISAGIERIADGEVGEGAMKVHMERPLVYQALGGRFSAG